MTSYKMVIAYDGTAYAGWQRQRDAIAVTNVLLNTFSRVFGAQASLVGASRTDAGVHALGQVARLITPLDIDPGLLMRAWNNALPDDITIRFLNKIDDTFHPQAHVRQKTYWYHLFAQRHLPFLNRFGYVFRYNFDIVKLEQALQIMVGTHDFRSFCTGDEQENTIRTIDEINVIFFKRFNVYRIEIKGKAFLRYMIRRIVGASLEIASRPLLDIAYLKKILDAKNPQHTLPNAPAKGLILARIVYDE